MRAILIDDMYVGNNLEESIKEYCEQGDFNLISFYEIDDRYIDFDGTEYAQVILYVE